MRIPSTEILPRWGMTCLLMPFSNSLLRRINLSLRSLRSLRSSLRPLRETFHLLFDLLLFVLFPFFNPFGLVLAGSPLAIHVEAFQACWFSTQHSALKISHCCISHGIASLQLNQLLLDSLIMLLFRSTTLYRSQCR